MGSHLVGSIDAIFRRSFARGRARSLRSSDKRNVSRQFERFQKIMEFLQKCNYQSSCIRRIMSACVI